MKKYQIVVTEIDVAVPFKDKEWVRAATDEEGHYEWFDSTRDEKEEVYNQTVETLDLPALVTFINNPTKSKQT